MNKEELPDCRIKECKEKGFMLISGVGWLCGKHLVEWDKKIKAISNPFNKEELK